MDEDRISLSALVERQAAAQPDEVAVDVVGGRAHTWAEYHEAGLRWAAALRGAGVAAGDPVLTMLPTAFDAVAVWLGCAWLGALEVPVHSSNRGTWLADLAGRVGARVAVVDVAIWPQWLPLLGDLPVAHVLLTGEGPGVAGAAGEVPAGVVVRPAAEALPEVVPPRPRHEPLPTDIACVLHTSGTTGASKGVQLPWATFEFRARHAQLPAWTRTAESVFYTPLPASHMSARRPWYEGALRGSRVVLREGFKTDRWLPDLRAHGCTISPLVGSMAAFLLSRPPRPDDADNPVRLVLMGPVVPDVDGFRERFGVEQVITGYGMTEIPHVFLAPATNATHRSVGVPIPGVTFRLADEAGADVGPGEVGELLVGGDPVTVNAGYYGMPEATGAAWRVLALARAYVSGASTVILDEVSMGLAPTVVAEIFTFIRRLAARGVGVLVVEQYVQQVLAVADLVYVLRKGRVAFAGEPAELDGDALAHQYLGVERAQPGGAPSSAGRRREPGW